MPTTIKGAQVRDLTITDDDISPTASISSTKLDLSNVTQEFKTTKWLHFSTAIAVGSVSDNNSLFLSNADSRIHIKDDSGNDEVVAYLSEVTGGGSGWTDDGATVRLTTATDSVGIGTTSPSEKLTVAGNIRAEAATSALIMRATDGIIDNLGLWKILVDDGTFGFSLQVNTAVGGDFSTKIIPLAADDLGVSIYGELRLFQQDSVGGTQQAQLRFGNSTADGDANAFSLYLFDGVNPEDQRLRFKDGASQPRILSQDDDFVTRETPAGAVNGINTIFTLSATPRLASEEVYLNGILQDVGASEDYTITGDTITFGVAPLAGDKIRVSYRRFA